jgi:hypothetical protein
MNTRITILLILTLSIVLTLIHSDRTLASHSLESSSAGHITSTENNGTDATSTPYKLSSDSLFHEVPSLSGRYSTEHMTFFPYLGASFGAGYNSELDRTFAPNLRPQHNLNLGNPSGQNLAPNEFQMGIRIPF